jgi:hypothetical protein
MRERGRRSICLLEGNFCTTVSASVGHAADAQPIADLMAESN